MITLQITPADDAVREQAETILGGLLDERRRPVDPRRLASGVERLAADLAETPVPVRIDPGRMRAIAQPFACDAGGEDPDEDEAETGGEG